MIKLKEFLESNDSTIIGEKKGWGYSVALAKIYNHTKDMIYIFKDNYCTGSDFNPLKMKEISLLGLYYKDEGIFYFEDELDVEYAKVDISDLEYSTLSHLKLEIEEEVNKRIFEKIGNDETKLNVNLEEIKPIDESYIKGNAEKLYLNNSEVEINSYALYSIKNMEDSFDTLLDCIKNKEDFIEKESSNYIEKNKNKIYSKIIINKKIKEFIEFIKDDINYIRTKELNSIFANKDLKTVTIKYKKDDNEMKFKINTRIYLYGKDATISSCKIQSLKDRETFENTFKDKRGLDYIEPEYIEEITHGKKVLYKKNA